MTFCFAARSVWFAFFLLQRGAAGAARPVGRRVAVRDAVFLDGRKARGGRAGGGEGGGQRRAKKQYAAAAATRCADAFQTPLWGLRFFGQSTRLAQLDWDKGVDWGGG